MILLPFWPSNQQPSREGIVCRRNTGLGVLPVALEVDDDTHYGLAKPLMSGTGWLNVRLALKSKKATKVCNECRFAVGFD
jgi:hypothetical protein